MPFPKVLFIAHNFYPLKGGAEYAIKTLLEELSSCCQCFVVAGGENKKLQIGKITCFLVKTIRQIEECVERIKPQLVLTHGPLAPFATTIAKNMGLPVILYVVDHCYFCPTPILMSSCDKNCNACSSYKKNKDMFHKMREMFSRVDKVVYDSKFIRKIGVEFYGIDGPVIYPFIRLKDSIVKRNPAKARYISMLKLMAHKGAQIFIEIAKKMPDKQFLAAGRKGAEIHIDSVTNLKYIGDVSPKRFFSETHILLVPSVWPDPGPRIVVEGLANKIPVLGSNVGGIPEVLAGGGILINDYQNPYAWIKKIRMLLENKRVYREIAAKGFAHTKWYNFSKEVDSMKKIIQSVMGKPL